jgi:hypothetical protein
MKLVRFKSYERRENVNKEGLFGQTSVVVDYVESGDIAFPVDQLALAAEVVGRPRLTEVVLRDAEPSASTTFFVDGSLSQVLEKIQAADRSER